MCLIVTAVRYSHDSPPGLHMRLCSEPAAVMKPKASVSLQLTGRKRINPRAEGMDMKKSDVVRLMRPYQRVLSRLIIDDAVSGTAPSSVEEAIERYTEQMGKPFLFVAGDWSGDIREAAIWTLLRNGFAKGKMVKMTADGRLFAWSGDRIDLEAASAIETEYGGNGALSARARDIVSQLKVVGAGSKAVYVYTDSRLDALGDHCTKIGRHHLSGGGEVLRRVLSQYSTGNPGLPVLRVIAKTDADVALESYLHKNFANDRIVGGFGTEWFAVPHHAVFTAIVDFFANQETDT